MAGKPGHHGDVDAGNRPEAAVKHANQRIGLVLPVFAYCLSCLQMLLYGDKLNELFEKIMNLEHFVGIVKKSVQEMDDEISASERECVSFLSLALHAAVCLALSLLTNAPEQFLLGLLVATIDSCDMCDGDSCVITNGPRVFEIGVCSLQ